MIRAAFAAKVTAWINTKLSADSPELCNVVGVVCLAECGITWQSTYALNSTHFKQYLSCCEVNVKQIKR